jgi:hypothetical protein
MPAIAISGIIGQRKRSNQGVLTLPWANGIWQPCRSLLTKL